MPAGGHDDTVAGDAYTSETAAAIPALVAGRYQIVRWLGGGGMGRVYEVLDTELGEKVALKKLRGNLDEESLERFRREVRLTRRIQHPNVARMFDIGEIDGERFLTMELVVGESLTSALGAPMPWSRLQKIATQICAGLAAAHDKGVVHRDLKPDNVLVETGTERIVLTDFGIARSSDEANVTQTGMIIGTPRYMAPEQLAGAVTDARADLFSLGVMLFELATGTRPWLGDNAIAIAVAQATQPRQPLTTRGLPVAFATCLDTLLAIDREQRPTSAAAVGNVLAAIAAPVPAPTGDPMIAQAPTMTHAMVTAVDPETAIAVLPFATSAGDEYISEGMREDLIDMLSKTPTLKVRPAGAIDSRMVDPREIGGKLGVDHVVVGSVRRIPTGLRVAARLINVADGFQVWAHRIDCGDAEVLAVGDQLGQAIATALSTRANKTHAGPTDPRAVELYLRARAELRRFWGEHALTASQLLEEAAQIAPTSAPISGLLACSTAIAWSKLNKPELLVKARAYIERALAMDHPEAYLAASTVHWNLGDIDQAARDTRYALDRAPMSAQVHETIGRMLTEIESNEAGRRHLETSIALDPSRRVVIRADLARIEALSGNYEAASQIVTELLADDDPAFRQFGSLLALRIALWRQDIAAALTAFDRAGRIRSAGLLLIDLVRAYLDHKPFDPDAWHRAIAEIAAPDRPRRMQVSILQRAIEVGVYIGQLDHAIAVFRIAADLGLADIVWLDKLPMLQIKDPRWQVLRDEVASTASRALAIFRPAGRSSQPTMLGVSGSHGPR